MTREGGMFFVKKEESLRKRVERRRLGVAKKCVEKAAAALL